MPGLDTQSQPFLAIFPLIDVADWMLTPHIRPLRAAEPPLLFIPYKDIQSPLICQSKCCDVSCLQILTLTSFAPRLRFSSPRHPCLIGPSTSERRRLCPCQCQSISLPSDREASFSELPRTPICRDLQCAHIPASKISRRCLFHLPIRSIFAHHTILLAWST